MAEAIYGGFWIRSLAYAADMSILMLALLLLAAPFVFMGGAGVALYSLFAAIGPFAYFAWLTASSRQTTFGKQLCGLKVQHAGSGERISLPRSIARELAKFVSAAVLFIGFLLAAFTQRKQGLHDSIAATVVVRDGPPRIVLAILVALAGVVIPVIVIPLMFGAAFAGLMTTLMGGMMGETDTKQTKPVSQMEQKAAPRPQASAAPAAKQAKAAAVDDPETVYRNFHQATIAADMEGLRKWGTKAKGDEFAAQSVVERKIILGLMGKVMPKTYTMRSSEVSPDGNKAILYLSAEVTDKGKTESVRGTATLLKEGGAWKVDESSWGGDQPSGPALKSAGAEPARPAPVEPAKPAAVELPKPVATTAPVFRQAPAVPAAQPRAAPSRSEPAAAKPAAPVPLQSERPCVYKPVMTDEEIARCR